MAGNRIAQADPLTQSQRVARILAVYARATEDERTEGLYWYRAANTFASGLSAKYGVTTEQAAGVIAALSPQTSWERNVPLAEKACRTKRPSGHTGANCAKARAILRGKTAPLDTLGGNKVRAFFDNIANPEESQAVTIDRHAYDIAEGVYTSDASRSQVANLLRHPVRYAHYAAAYREAARILNLRPLQVHAVTWVAWRNLKANATLPFPFAFAYGEEVAA